MTTNTPELIERLEDCAESRSEPKVANLIRESATAIRELQADRERMRNRIESLRGMLKSCAGWFGDVDRIDLADQCMEVTGDMEAKL